jgi:hypothetical protein
MHPASGQSTDWLNRLALPAAAALGQAEHGAQSRGRVGRREGGGGSGRELISAAYTQRAGIPLGVESLLGSSPAVRSS